MVLEDPRDGSGIMPSTPCVISGSQEGLRYSRTTVQRRTHGNGRVRTVQVRNTKRVTKSAKIRTKDIKQASMLSLFPPSRGKVKMKLKPRLLQLQLL